MIAAIGEIVGAIREGVAVAVDGDAIGLAVPGADRRLQVADESSASICCLHPVGHLVEQAAAGRVALEGRAHLDDVEVDGAGGDRLLQARIVVGLGEVDPVDLGAGVGLPRLQEAAEQDVVEVLVVEPHEGELDAGELALGDVGLGRAEAQLADLLPVGIGGRPRADARDLQDLGAKIVLRERLGQGAENAGGTQCGDGCGGCGAAEELAPAGLHGEQTIVDFDFHGIPLPFGQGQPLHLAPSTVAGMIGGPAERRHFSMQPAA